MSNVIAYGQTFLDLVLHVSAYIKTNMQAVYTPVDPAHQRYARAITEIALTKRLHQGKGRDNEWSRKFRARIEMFLLLFNGNWKDSRSTAIRHHCSMKCKCGGLSQQNLAEAAATVFIELVLCSRPPIPALPRWLKCSETAKWYLLGAHLLVCFCLLQSVYRL